MDSKEITAAALDLRRQHKFREAYQLVHEATIDIRGRESLLWQHLPILWSDIQAGVCILSRRNGSDAAFIESLWRNQDFMYSFHRHASSLPTKRSDLVRILERDFVSTIDASRALHWVVRYKDSTPWGVLSLVEISLIHKRAEVMIGLLPGAPIGLSTAAMLMLFQFYFKVMKFNKLMSLVYDDNPHSLKSTLHLGFKVEGRLRQHVIDPRLGVYVDLIQTGAVASDIFNRTTERLMERLLSN
jgi:RimJ/RimL family protein N-acetyltransferase